MAEVNLLMLPRDLSYALQQLAEEGGRPSNSAAGAGPRPYGEAKVPRGVCFLLQETSAPWISFQFPSWEIIEKSRPLSRIVKLLGMATKSPRFQPRW